MPTYEYECLECGHRFDAFQNMSDNPLTECEHCKGPVKRLISGGSGIIFKGSGFYVTDNKGKSLTSGNTGSHDKTDKPGPTDNKTEVKSDTGKSADSGSGSKPKPKKETAAAK